MTDVTNYNGGTMASGDFSVDLHHQMQEYNSANIEGRISIEGRAGIMPVSMRVAEFLGEDRITDYNKQVSKLDPSKPVWVVVHGREDQEDSDQISELARNLQSHDVQVVTLDWNKAAKDNVVLVGLQGTRWIEAVGTWAANQLQSLEFTTENIQIVGHSYLVRADAKFKAKGFT